jgi:hypothetical protein
MKSFMRLRQRSTVLLPQPERADERGDVVRRYADIGVAHREKCAVVELLDLAVDHHVGRCDPRGGLGRARRGHGRHDGRLAAGAPVFFRPSQSVDGHEGFSVCLGGSPINVPWGAE